MVLLSARGRRVVGQDADGGDVGGGGGDGDIVDVPAFADRVSLSAVKVNSRRICWPANEERLSEREVKAVVLTSLALGAVGGDDGAVAAGADDGDGGDVGDAAEDVAALAERK